ncbi:MAG: helix-turn-helix domain-containing protein [Carnobacterium sp.]|nr:helix-turn-helix domain-containing protein [Carnobacterium sp.]
MDSPLTPQVAQNIVNRTMEILTYNINVMDKEGKIIGSGDPRRLLMKHGAAVEVINQKNTVEIKGKYNYADDGVKEGINLPIIINDEIIGVVGITGEIDKIRGYGELVKMTAEMIVEQSLLENELRIDERIKREVIAQLISKKNNYDTLFYKKIKIMQLNLNEFRVAVIIKSNGDQLKQLNYLTSSIKEVIEENDLYATMFTGEIVILKKVNIINGKWDEEQTLHTLRIWLTKLNKLEIDISISIGSFYEEHKSWWKSYEESKDALFIGEKLGINQKIFQYKELSLYILLSKMEPIIKETAVYNVYDKLKEKDSTLDLQKTLKSYIRNDGNIHNTSEELFIHRNTVKYRLEKIKKITGKNPYIYRDLFELSLSLIVSNLDG